MVALPFGEEVMGTTQLVHGRRSFDGCAAAGWDLSSGPNEPVMVTRGKMVKYTRVQWQYYWIPERE